MFNISTLYVSGICHDYTSCARERKKVDNQTGPLKLFSSQYMYQDVVYYVDIRSYLLDMH